MMKFRTEILLAILSFVTLPAIAFADPGVYYKEAIKHLKRGETEFAFLKFNRIIETYPDSQYADEALYRVGEHHFTQSNLFDAEKYLKKHRESYPNSSFKDDVKILLHSISVIRLLDTAKLNYQNGDWQGAFRDYGEIVGLRPFETKAEEKFNQFRNSLFNAIIAKADRAFKDKKFDEALALYGKANTLGVQQLDEKIKACNENIEFIGSLEFSVGEFEGSMTPEALIQAVKTRSKIDFSATDTPIKSLNNLLERQDLYKVMQERSDETKDSISRVEQGQQLSPLELKRLNRLLIEVNYPLETPKRQFIKQQGAKGLVQFKGSWMTENEKEARVSLEKGDEHLKKEECGIATVFLKQALHFDPDLQSVQEKIGQCNRMLEFEKEQAAKGLVKYQGKWVAPSITVSLGEENIDGKDGYNFYNGETVINNAFNQFFNSLKYPKFPDRYLKKEQNYYDTRIEMGSSHVDMMPFLLTIVKHWYPQISYLYGHYRQGYVLVIIEFNQEIDAGKMSESFAESFSQVAYIEGRVTVRTPSYEITWYFKDGRTHR